MARLIASGAAQSKADLVPAAGMARTTVSAAVDELLNRGVVRVAGTRPTPGRGRPADRLALSPRGGHVLLADVGARGAHLAVLDLSQQVVAHEHVDLDVRDGPEPVLDVIEARLDALRAAGSPEVPARAVVIGLPGPVDGNLGTPVRPPIMPGWHAYPVSARLQGRFGCAGDPGERRQPARARRGQGAARGPGPAALREDRHGHRRRAGHAGGRTCTTAPTARRATSGTSGCAAAPTTRASAATSAASRPSRRPPPSPGAWPRARTAPVTIADVRARLAKADPAAVAHVREAAAHIGELVAMLVHFYNPARVTIGGSLTAASDDLLAGVRSVVYQRALPLATRNLVLANSVLGEYAGLAGPRCWASSRRSRRARSAR